MKPIKKNILVKLDERTEVTTGGIVIPERSQGVEEWGTVVGVGQQCEDLSVGDRVYIQKTQGTRYVENGVDMLIIPESKVLAMETASS